MRIALLHTAESNIAVFEAAAQALGRTDLAMHHIVRPELLADAERAGGLTQDIADRARAELLELAGDADAVLLTCSTLGRSVDGLSKKSGKPVLRVDAALAEAAVARGGHIVVLCAVETTIAPTTELFRLAAEGTSATFDVQLVAGAWAKFKARDRDGYLAMIAEAADVAYADGASIVALGQASMAGAAAYVSEGPTPLISPIAALEAAIGAVLNV